MAVEAIKVGAIRERQRRGEPDGRLIGLGIAAFSEQTAHGTTADGKRRALYEQAFARITPDGRLDLRAGIQSIGQGLETTLAQIACECLGVDLADVHVKLGDTELSPYSSGARAHAASSGRVGRPHAPARNWPRAWPRSARRCCKLTSPPCRCAMAACTA